MMLHHGVMPSTGAEQQCAGVEDGVDASPGPEVPPPRPNQAETGGSDVAVR